MSGPNFDDEDIREIIQKPLSPTIKSPRYKSKRKFSDSIKKKYNGHQTFGLAHYEAPESKNFLRKRKQSNVPPPKTINKKEFKCTINCKSSPIPKPSLEKTKQVRKNFVKENIKKALALKPKVPVPRRVETPRGTSKDLAHLLQMIKIRESEEYGRIPKYLSEEKKKEEKRREKERLHQEAVQQYKEKMGIGTMGMDENVYMIDAETRQKILDGLKENWNELSKQFLKLPVMTDTWPKIKRKMFLEKEIEQLEKDIRLVESHPYIYLERTDRRSFSEIAADEGRKSSEAEKQGEKEPSLGKKESLSKKESVTDETKEQGEDKEDMADEEACEEKKEEDKEINIYNY